MLEPAHTHSKDGDVTCVSIPSLVIDAHDILIQKEFYKLYVLSVCASTARVRGEVSTLVQNA